MSSRNNPEMSQHSSDVPILVNFSIYFHDIFTELAGIIKIINSVNSPLRTILSLCQKLLKNRKCLNFLMFLQGDHLYGGWAGEQNGAPL